MGFATDEHVIIGFFDIIVSKKNFGKKFTEDEMRDQEIDVTDFVNMFRGDENLLSYNQNWLDAMNHDIRSHKNSQKHS